MFHFIIRFAGLDLIAKLAHRPNVGETVTIKAGGKVIPMIYDGMGLFPKDMPASTAKIVVPMAVEPPAPEPAAIPAWAFESTDPRIEYMVEQSANGDEFYALLYGSAWKDALLLKGDAAAEETALGLRWAQLDAKQARIARRSVSPGRDIKNAVKHPRLGRKDAAGEYLTAMGVDDPITPEDAVVFATDTADMDSMSELVSADAERDGDWGVEHARVEWSMDVIGELLAHTGQIRGDDEDLRTVQAMLRLMRQWEIAGMDTGGYSAELNRQAKSMAENIERQAQYPLASVIATLAAKRAAGQFTDKQLAFIDRILGVAGMRETIEMRKNAKGENVACPVQHRIVNRLWNNIQALEWDVDEALDEYEQRQAEWDEIAHPRKAKDEPKVEVSLDRQATFLDYVAKTAKTGSKPWMSHPSYIAALDAAFNDGARDIKTAHNRAYAADTLRMPDRILGYDKVAGFTVMLNKSKQQTGIVPATDARAAFPHLPASAKARMKQLSTSQNVAPLAQ